MKNLWVLLIPIALVVGGCHSPSTTYDPFLGRSTVPPPQTGTVTSGAPYYGAAAGPAAVGGAAPLYNPAAAQSLSPNGAPGQFAPPGGYPAPPPGGYQAPPATFQTAPPTAMPVTPPPGYGAQNVPALTPDPHFSTAAASPLVTIPPTAEPPRLEAPNAFAGAGRSSPANGRSMFDPAVMPASYNAVAPTASPSTVNKPISTSSLRIVGTGSENSSANRLAEPPAGAIVAEASRAGATYSYDASYRLLQGKLEFLQSQNKWKLRYIPADGQTDDFGGSVILSDSPVLANYQAGDFVTVQGGVAQTAPSRGFAPQFQLSRIARQ